MGQKERGRKINTACGEPRAIQTRENSEDPHAEQRQVSLALDPGC